MDRRVPVLVGVGVAHGRGEEAADLMAAALTGAAADAGVMPLLHAIDDIGVPQGTWSYSDPGRLVAAALGARRARTALAAVGVPQQTLVNRALELIRSGRADVVAVVGADTKARAAAATRGGADAPETGQAGAVPDIHLHPSGEMMASAEVAAGIWEPVVQYALIENALGHAEGRTPDELQDDVADLWARFNTVAGTNPDAAFGEPRTAAFLRHPGPANRLLAFPYNKWHSTQWRVDQAAALLFCSAGAATTARVSPDRWVFPLVGLESSHSVSLMRRRDLHRWPAMRVLGRAASERLGRPLEGVEHVELYSCFPSAVRVQQRELAIPPDGTPTVTGGMAFAGGPFNNFTYQATAAVVARCRAAPGSVGLVTTVSGLLTKPGLALWSTEPSRDGVVVADLADAAAGETAVVDVADIYTGDATVATYTVIPGGEGIHRVAVIADTTEGVRVAATCDDEDVARFATERSLIGTSVVVDGPRFQVVRTGETA